MTDRVAGQGASSGGDQTRSFNRYPVAAAVLACMGVALLLRSLGAPWVFIDGDVMLDPWDGAYHARRAYYSFINFPSILYFDAYLRFPDGAPVPFPPLYDWGVAAVARLFGDSEAVFTKVAAWVSPIFAMLTVLPVYALGRRVRGWQVGLIASALFAVFPASVMNTGIGDLDHHAAVAFLLALLIACGAALLEADTENHIRRSLLLAMVRAALVLSWTGSLLYVAVGEAALLLGGLFVGRKQLFLSQALGLGVSALLIAPWVYVAGSPIGGAFSSTEMSWLHVTALLFAASVWAGLWWWQQQNETRAPVDQFKRAGFLVAIVGIGGLLIPPVRNAITPGIAFVAKADTWAPLNAEQAPLFAWTQSGPAMGADFSLTMFGVFSLAIPLLPIIVAWPLLRSDRRALHIALFCWAVVLSVLALMQMRFCNDLAPVASVGFALAIDRARTFIAAKSNGAVGVAVAVVGTLALLWPALQFHSPRMPLFFAYLSGERPNFDASLYNGDSALVRFAELIREVTPETSGYFEAGVEPEYSVMSLPSHGHVIHYAARRPTPANNFGPYLDAEKVEIVNAAYNAPGEAEVVELLDSVRARYWMTSEAFWLREGSFVHFLHRGDGVRWSVFNSAQNLRLVAESLPGTRPTFASFPSGAPERITPYKLWERVEGALLLVQTNAAERVRVELDVVTNTGRPFRYAAATRADAQGVARLRVPYSTENRAQGKSIITHAASLYTVASADHRLSIAVADAQVLRGATIFVELK
jgi:asparagine N-glycosylation enzyme membrane subunit Stt3